jgi:glycosyltransferase involved in cell wall biosynthesis
MQAPRILFIPEEKDAGTSDRIPVLMRILKQRHEVIGLASLWSGSIYATDRPKAPRYALYVIERALACLRGLRLARKHRVQIVFCETPHHALVGLWISRVLGLPCVWDSHGNALLFARSMGRGRFYTWLTAWLDGFLGRRVDALITVSQRDADAYVDMGVPRSRIRVIPTSVDLDRIDELARRSASQVPDAVPVTPGRSLLFFGSFKYAPNLEAFRFINDRLAPYLVEEGIPCEIRLAGRDVPEDNLHPSIRRLGFVEDIHEWIRRSELCVVPVWNGVGILTKVVDIMASRTPAVLSSFVVHGIPEIRDGVHAIVVSREDEFPERVAFALRHGDEMRAMAETARTLVEKRYDWKVYEPVFEDLLTSLTQQSERG